MTNLLVKRRKPTTTRQHSPPQDQEDSAGDLIPGLPDHVAQICLSSINPSLLYSVSRSWRLLLSSPSFPPYLSIYALLSNTNQSVHFFNFDPLTTNWTQLPPPPPSIRFTLHHNSFLSLNLPIQSLSVSGKLVIVAATDPLLRPALDSPLIFDPATRSWTYGPEMTYPRRWCAAGCSNGAVYVASGVGSHFKTSVAKSVERWRCDEIGDEREIRWEEMRLIKDGRLSREAIEAIGCRGKLYMVNVRGNSVKEGFVYDTVNDEWEEMKEGMVGGWRGPAVSIDEVEICVVDDKKGVLMRYVWEKDAWCEILQSELLKGAERMAAGGGRICVVVGGGIVMVDVACRTPRVWVVEMPDGLRANSVHVLPRMV